MEAQAIIPATGISLLATPSIYVGLYYEYVIILLIFCGRWQRGRLAGFVMSVLRNLPSHPSLFMQTRREIQDENDDSDFWGSISLRRGFYR